MSHRQEPTDRQRQATTRRKRGILGALGIVQCSVVMLALLLNTSVFAASEPCSPPNVLPASVCDMDAFYGAPPRQLPQGWTPFVLSGDLTFMQDVDTLWGPPSLRMWSNGGTFKAGIFTQVQVTAGAGYRASVAWAAPNEPDTFGRQLGIDPTGGTDPNGSTVVWGPTHWGPGRLLNYPPGQGPNIDVVARAQSEVITVFFLTDHNRSTGDNFIFVDTIALYPDEGAPALAPPTPAPTDTPVPVVAAAVAPTATPIPPTPLPSDTPQPTPSPTPTATPSPSPTSTPSPTATVTPRWTPWPTITPASGVRAGGGDLRAELADLSASRPGLMWAVGLFGLLAAGIFGGSLWRIRR